MDILVLREFYALSQSLNYSSTAKRLFISQSVLSKHIQSLERELGMRLFVRDSHSVRLTATGRLFSERVGVILREYDDAICAVKELNKGLSSVLNVGFIPDTTRHFFTDACELFKEQMPNSKLNIFPMEAEAVVEAVKEGKIDVGVTLFLLDSPFDGIEYSILEHERMGVLVNSKHPLAKQDSASVFDLAGEKVLVPNPVVYPVMGKETVFQLKKAFPEIDLMEETTGLGSIGPLLKINEFVAVTYECTTRFYAEGFTFVSLNDIDISAATGVLWKASRENLGIKVFLRCLNDVLFGSDKSKES